MPGISFRLAVIVLLLAPVAGAMADKIDSRACKPVEVAILASRLHVKCAPIPKKAETEDIMYFAMSVKDKDGIFPFTLETLLAAKAADRDLKIWYDRSDYKSVKGCNGSDCRRLTGVVMY